MLSLIVAPAFFYGKCLAVVLSACVSLWFGAVLSRNVPAQNNAALAAIWSNPVTTAVVKQGFEIALVPRFTSVLVRMKFGKLTAAGMRVLFIAC